MKKIIAIALSLFICSPVLAQVFSNSIRGTAYERSTLDIRGKKITSQGNPAQVDFVSNSGQRYSLPVINRVNKDTDRVVVVMPAFPDLNGTTLIQGRLEVSGGGTSSSSPEIFPLVLVKRPAGVVFDDGNTAGAPTVDSSGAVGSGAQGPTGPQGPAGANGAAGATGPQGPVGATGSQGPVGATGPAGAAGPQGPVGATGSQGPVGATGATGAQGPVGATGSQGPVGATGPAGAVGPQGPAADQNGITHLPNLVLAGKTGVLLNVNGSLAVKEDFNVNGLVTLNGTNLNLPNGMTINGRVAFMPATSAEVSTLSNTLVPNERFVDVTDTNVIVISNNGASTDVITELRGGISGQLVTFTMDPLSTNTVTIIDNDTNTADHINLQEGLGSPDGTIVFTAGDTLQLININGSWFQLSISNNSN